MSEDPTRTYARGPAYAEEPTRRQRKLAKRIVEKYWRARWDFDATGLTVVCRDGLRLRFEGI